MGRPWNGTIAAIATTLLGTAAATATLGAAAAAVRAAEPTANGPLTVVYPSDGRETTSDRIFIIGNAPPGTPLTVNGQDVHRSPTGNFAPSFPLVIGPNTFELRYGQTVRTLTVRRRDSTPQPEGPTGMVPGSLRPGAPIARMAGEPICWQVTGLPGAQVALQLGDRAVPLRPQPAAATLPGNGAALIGNNDPTQRDQGLVNYGGCAALGLPGESLSPRAINVRRDGQTSAIAVPAVSLLGSETPTVVEVTASPAAVARTGPSTNHSRLTPLPQGARAAVTGREGDWLRLDYGPWILASEARELPDAIAPHTAIRSLRSVVQGNTTDIRIPLEVPVPVSIAQGTDWIDLTLHNATAQTDTIAVGADAILERLDWHQPEPGRVVYRFNLKGRPWGYALRYDGTTLVLTLNHPPRRTGDRPLSGTTIAIDPGHGGNESGSVGPTGYPEKAANLAIADLLIAELERRGARVVSTRTDDRDVSLADRQAAIAQLRPTLALSIHYNALPDGGDAENTRGIGMFWYHPQAQDLAEWLHDRLTKTLDRPSYGVFWGNLALTRPTEAPTVLMELGFTINPEEFEWIVNSTERQRLAIAIADAIVHWLDRRQGKSSGIP